MVSSFQKSFDELLKIRAVEKRHQISDLIWPIMRLFDTTDNAHARGGRFFLIHISIALINLLLIGVCVGAVWWCQSAASHHNYRVVTAVFDFEQHGHLNQNQKIKHS